MIVKKTTTVFSPELLSSLVNSHKGIFMQKNLALASAIFYQPKMEMHYTL